MVPQVTIGSGVELGLFGIICVLAAALAAYGQAPADRPMPCDETEVYVWASYPSRAVCEPAEDHDRHQGAET